MSSPQEAEAVPLGGRLGRSLSLLVALYLAWAPAARAQHMFLDANGDGRNTREDQVPPVGWSKLDVWLDTARNRDGSPSPPTAGEAAPGIAAYAFLIQVSGNAVEWGAYRPGDPGMVIVRGPLTDSLTFYVEVGCRPPLKAGMHKLGEVRLNPRWGQAAISILPCAVVTDTLATFFKAKQGGPPLRLGPTATFGHKPGVVPGDWHDADGVSFASEPKPSAGPVRVDHGILYLGWNRMRPPFELRVVDGRAVVNGLAPPERIRPRTEISNQTKAKFGSDVFAGAVGMAFHKLGASDSVANEAVAEAYRLSPAVDSVSMESVHLLHVYYRGVPPERRYSVSLTGWEPRRPWVAPSPESLMAGILGQWARLLERGTFLQIRSLGSHFVVGGEPEGSAIDRAIQVLQSDGPLSAADSEAIRHVARSPAEWEAVRHPVRLERVGP